jgi:hypothetical protein
MVMSHRIEWENLINLCNHTDDFGTDVDLHFFKTSLDKDMTQDYGNKKLQGMSAKLV